jgi:hypothetical protein
MTYLVGFLSAALFISLGFSMMISVSAVSLLACRRPTILDEDDLPTLGYEQAADWPLWFKILVAIGLFLVVILIICLDKLSKDDKDGPDNKPDEPRIPFTGLIKKSRKDSRDAIYN